MTYSSVLFLQVKNVATQTPSHDAAELMCSEEPTEKYWELLAEQRRKALKEALEENEKVLCWAMWSK